MYKIVGLKSSWITSTYEVFPFINLTNESITTSNLPHKRANTLCSVCPVGITLDKMILGHDQACGWRWLDSRWPTLLSFKQKCSQSLTKILEVHWDTRAC